MSSAAVAAIKAAILALTDENTRKKIGWVLVAILSPIILIVALICSIFSSTSQQNVSTVELCFHGGTISSEVTPEYRQYVLEMRESFGTLDSMVEEINDLLEEGNSLDANRVKAIFYVLYFGGQQPEEVGLQSFVDCFVTYTDGTRTVIDTDEEGSEVTRGLFLENLRKAADMAAAKGILMGFETMETELMNTVGKAMDYVKRVDSVYLNVYPDLGNITNAAVLYGTDVLEDLETGRGRLTSMHLKETVPGKFREIPYGTGHVDFEAGIKKAWELGVRRYVSARAAAHGYYRACARHNRVAVQIQPRGYTYVAPFVAVIRLKARQYGDCVALAVLCGRVRTLESRRHHSAVTARLHAESVVHKKFARFKRHVEFVRRSVYLRVAYHRNNLSHNLPFSHAPIVCANRSLRHAHFVYDHFFKRSVVKVGTDGSYSVHYVHTVRNLAESRVLSVQVRGSFVHDEKLAARAVGIHRPCHGQHSALVLQVVFHAVCPEFALDAVSGAARPVASGTAALNHKALYHAVEGQPVIKALFYQVDKIFYRNGRDVGIKLRLYLAHVGVDYNVYRIFFCHNNMSL